MPTDTKGEPWRTVKEGTTLRRTAVSPLIISSAYTIAGTSGTHFSGLHLLRHAVGQSRSPVLRPVVPRRNIVEETPNTDKNGANPSATAAQTFYPRNNPAQARLPSQPDGQVLPVHMYVLESLSPSRRGTSPRSHHRFCRPRLPPSPTRSPPPAPSSSACSGT